ncbi:MAG: ribosome biogenesis GTPase Der [Alphaproteobacteria bacterium]|nr:ribosome biogenesis GTPase Der [Alphaproteobacteria bacterium]
MQLDRFNIALIGRTNVGKSTLFNRLTNSRSALSFDRPGVTRDLKEQNISINEKNVTLIDTPGMFDYNECDNKPELINAINKKLSDVISKSNLIIFVVDGNIGFTPNDLEISRILRKSGKDIILAVNKCEKELISTYSDVVSLGFPEIIQISAEHGSGIDELYDTLNKYIPEEYKAENTDEQNEIEVIKLAVIGRPNVGKSTIVNKLIKEEKQLVADFAGLTRESSFSDFEFNNRLIRIIDTPGIRRKSKINDVLEKISVSNSKNSYRRADVVILMIDASTLECGEIEKQDLALASDVVKEGKALVVAFNKYDKTPYKKNDTPEFLKRNFSKSLSQLKDVPFIFVSALNNENVIELLKLALDTFDKQKIKIKTSNLNDWLFEFNKSDTLQSGSARFKLKYITQVGVNPLSFLIFVKNKGEMRKDHQRFIENNFKQYFNILGIAINIIFKETNKREK